MAGRKTDISKMKISDIEKKLPEDTQELVKDIRLGRHDPIYFGNALLGLDFHDGQKLWLWMTTKTQLDKALELGLKTGRWKTKEEFAALRELNPDMLKNILVPSNRWGKTFITTVKHLWYCMYKIGVYGNPSQVAHTRCGSLNISPHSNQCQAGYDYVLDIINSKLTYSLVVDEKGNPLDPENVEAYDNGELKSFRNECRIPDFVTGSNSQKRLISFKNGTTYRAVPTGEDQASSLAGTRYLYISYDECAQSLHLKEELPAKIMSRLIDFGGPLDLVSTPEVDKPSHQYFHHIAKLGLEGKEGWFTLVGKLPDNYFLRKKEVDAITEAIRQTDPAKYRQVKFGEFVTTGKKMFDNILVERIWDGFDESYPQVGHKYIISADWGFSDTGDPTVFYVLDYTEALSDQIPKHLRKYRIVFREAIRGGSPVGVMSRARILQREWNGGIFIHDSSSMGGIIIKKMLREMNMTNIHDFNASGDKMDMLFTLITVMSANRRTDVDKEGKVTDLNADFGRLRSSYIPELEEQMGNYQYNPDKGVTDKRIDQDEVMSLGQAIWYLERKVFKMTPKQIQFNPLAPNVEGIFSDKEAQKLGIHNVAIPEKRIF